MLREFQGFKLQSIADFRFYNIFQERAIDLDRYLDGICCKETIAPGKVKVQEPRLGYKSDGLVNSRLIRGFQKVYECLGGFERVRIGKVDLGRGTSELLQAPGVCSIVVSE